MLADILLIGRLLMDQYLLIKQYPARGQDAVIRETFERVGGCTYNAAATIKNLGGDPLILSPLNCDERGGHMLALLRQKGFREDLLFTVDGDTSYCLVLLENDGERTFLTYTGSQSDLIGPKGAAALALAPAYVHLSGYSLVEQSNAAVLMPLLSALKSGGTKLLFDPGPLCREIPPLLLNDMLNISDIFCPNRAELLAITSHLGVGEDYFTSSSYLKDGRLVLIKDGARGVAAFQDADRYFVPAFDVPGVDGTGAGDSFAGGLLFALARGDDLNDALRLASACGALTAAVLGPQAELSLAEIETLINRGWE
ncbi:MAG: carbohydrate kinase family protein [Anaerolineae bacterium]|nr:carbohydrate kinase family protein [Anaerolineae bacterium]